MSAPAAALWPLAWVAGGVVSGLLLQLALLLPFQKLARRRGLNALATIAAIISGVIVLWCALAGLYLGLGAVALTIRTGLFLDRAIVTLAILSVTWVIARFFAEAIAAYGRQADTRIFSASLYANVAQGAVFLVGILTVLATFGVSIAPLLTTLGLGGLAVAIALRDTLSNLFAGIHIVASRQIRPGDFVRFDFGVEGEVTDIKWRNTTIRDLQNSTVIVPNEKVAGSVLVNYSLGSPDQLMPVSATLPWKGTYRDLETLAGRAANGAAVEITGVNEASVQITAYLPAAAQANRGRAAADFLRRLYEAARTARMGSD